MADLEIIAEKEVTRLPGYEKQVEVQVEVTFVLPEDNDEYVLYGSQNPYTHYEYFSRELWNAGQEDRMNPEFNRRMLQLKAHFSNKSPDEVDPFVAKNVGETF